MSETSVPPAAPSAHSHGAPQPAGRPAAAGGPQVQRQFVNFAFYKLDPAARRLSADEKRAAREEFVAAVNARPQGMMCLSYSTAGLKAETDFLLGIYNRRGFQRELDRAIAYIKRYHASGALIVLDVARLKPVNDTLSVNLCSTFAAYSCSNLLLMSEVRL